MKWRGGGSKQNDIVVLWKFSFHLVRIYIMFPVEQKDFITRTPSFLVSSAIIDLASDIKTEVVNSNAEKMASQQH